MIIKEKNEKKEEDEIQEDDFTGSVQQQAVNLKGLKVVKQSQEVTSQINLGC